MSIRLSSPSRCVAGQVCPAAPVVMEVVSVAVDVHV